MDARLLRGLAAAAVERGEWPSEAKPAFLHSYHAADHQAWSGCALSRSGCEVCRVSEAAPLSFTVWKPVRYHRQAWSSALADDGDLRRPDIMVIWKSSRRA